MPTREQVRRVRDTGNYVEIGEQPGVTAGLAYLIATGLPADGSDVPPPEEAKQRGVPDSSTQHLANPVTEPPKDKPGTAAWRTRRARADDTLQQATRARRATPPAERRGRPVRADEAPEKRQE